jgi:DNA-binding GntR family transcriptional regulator
VTSSICSKWPHSSSQHGQPDEVFRINHQIHKIIHLPGLSNRLASQLRTALQYVPAHLYGQVAGWVDASTHDHAAIFAALDAADPEGARAAMAEHIRHVGELLAKHLEGSGVFDDQASLPTSAELIPLLWIAPL